MADAPEQMPSELANTSQLGGLTFQLPDTSAFDQQIADERKTAQTYEQKAVAMEEQAADAQMAEAQQIPNQMAAFDQLLKQYPTRDVAYGNAMHSAPILAIMTALGGKLTRLNGLEMLGATNGLMKGLNEGAESQFQESLSKWQAAYQRQKDLFEEQNRARQLMLSAYAGRSDAYQKAADAARRMTGDLLELKQDKIKNQIDLYKVQEQQMAQLERSREAWARIAEQRKRDAEQINRWHTLITNATDPRVKAQLQANQHEWLNLKSQVDELLRRRGQITQQWAGLTETERAAALGDIDARVQGLQVQMNEVEQRGGEIANTMPTANAPPNPSPAVGGPSAYQTKDDVVNAVKSGQLSWLAAHKILKDQFGMTD